MGGNNIIIEKVIEGSKNYLKNRELNEAKRIFGSNIDLNRLIIKGFESLSNVKIIFLIS